MSIDLNEKLTDAEIEALAKTRSETDQCAVVDEILSARAGRYPRQWFMQVMVSGLYSKIVKSWGVV